MGTPWKTGERAIASLKTRDELVLLLDKHTVKERNCLLWTGPVAVYVGAYKDGNWIYLSPKQLAWVVTGNEPLAFRKRLFNRCGDLRCVRHIGSKPGDPYPLYDGVDCPRCKSEHTYSTGPNWWTGSILVGHPRVCGVCWYLFLSLETVKDSLIYRDMDEIFESFRFQPDPGEWLQTVMVPEFHVEIPLDFYPRIPLWSWLA